jgi:hypothetical protein
MITVYFFPINSFLHVFHESIFDLSEVFVLLKRNLSIKETDGSENFSWKH